MTGQRDTRGSGACREGTTARSSKKGSQSLLNMLMRERVSFGGQIFTRGELLRHMQQEWEGQEPLPILEKDNEGNKIIFSPSPSDKLRMIDFFVFSTPAIADPCEEDAHP